MPAARHVVVDGSNIATEGNSLPSLKQLDEAVREYLHENPDDLVTVVVDATFGHRIPQEELELFEQAEREGDIVSPPAGAIGRGDAFLLRVADKVGAVVLSNDSFQEFHGEYGWLFDKGRLIGGKPVPGVGWIFTPRSPVRGPKSRQSIKEAKRQRDGEQPEPEGSGLELAAERSRGKAGEKKVQRAIATATEEAEVPEKDARKRRRRRRAGEPPSEPLNDPLTFISFIAAHRLGEEVEGVIEEFSSHGAFISAGGARCYVPLSAMGDPPPRSAREVLRKGEPSAFVVQAFDAMRRGIELALPGYAHPSGAPTPETVDAEIHIAEELREPGPEPRAGRDKVPQLAAQKASGPDGPRRRRGEKTLAGRGAREDGDHDGRALGLVAEPAEEGAQLVGARRRRASRARGTEAAAPLAEAAAGAGDMFPGNAQAAQAGLGQETVPATPARAPRRAKAAPAEAASHPPTAEHVKETSAPMAAAKVGAPGRKAAPATAEAGARAAATKVSGRSKAAAARADAAKGPRSKKTGVTSETGAKKAAAKATATAKKAAGTAGTATKGKGAKGAISTKKSGAVAKATTEGTAVKRGPGTTKAATSVTKAVARRVTKTRAHKAEEAQATTAPRKAATTRLPKTAAPAQPLNRVDGLPSATIAPSVARARRQSKKVAARVLPFDGEPGEEP